MDELICKAKTLDGRWVEGYYVKHMEAVPCPIGDKETLKKMWEDWTKHYIYYDGLSDWGLPRELLRKEVDIDTLCRFTGVVLNGKQVFENDIIELEGIDDCGVKHFILPYIVKYNPREYCWEACLINSHPDDKPLKLSIFSGSQNGCSVVGNIFDKVDYR